MLLSRPSWFTEGSMYLTLAKCLHYDVGDLNQGKKYYY